MLDRIEEVERGGRNEEVKNHYEPRFEFENRNEVVDRFKHLEQRLEKIVIDQHSQSHQF